MSGADDDEPSGGRDEASAPPPAAPVWAPQPYQSPGQPTQPLPPAPGSAPGTAPVWTLPPPPTSPGQGATGAFLGGPGLPAPPEPRRRGVPALVLLAAVLAAAVLGGVVGGSLARNGAGGGLGRPTISLPQSPSAGTARPPDTVAGVAAAVLPSVVAMKVRSASESGTGSGFVLDASKGYILTNNHVVAAGGLGSETITVVFQDGTHVPGTVVGKDASYDLAVVQVRANGLRALTFGDSDGVVVGDPVIAVGAPLGLQGTVTTGIVSALNRPVAAGQGDQPAFINAIQTDAAINPGNSGGPLVDARGRVIGVNSAIAQASGGTFGGQSGNIGVGFAIPSNQARRTAEQLIATGKARHPIIGVTLDRSYDGEGVKVSDGAAAGQPPVRKGGPADKAGIRPGDVIVALNGRPMTEPDELIVAIRARQPGDKVVLTIRRGSEERKVTVTLDASTE